MSESPFAPDEFQQFQHRYRRDSEGLRIFADELHRVGFSRPEAMEILVGYVSSWRPAPVPLVSSEFVAAVQKQADAMDRMAPAEDDE